MIPRILAGIGALVTLIAVNAQVVRYEAALSTGERVYLPIEGYDPRSLLQGDYMRFQALVQPDRPADRVGAAKVDADGVILSVHAGAPSGPGERVIRWRKDDERVAFGANEWFIEEGTADAYVGFRYAVLHLSDDGGALLVGLADADRALMGPRPAKWVGSVAPPRPSVDLNEQIEAPIPEPFEDEGQ
jgi:uncharacterized membrane-anchored protein